MEKWKVVEGTNEMLEVSNMGRLKSNLRDGRILKPTADKKGYLRLRMTINKKRFSFKVHRLVAINFIDNPLNKPQVNHIDGDKTNNKVENLEWVSNLENAHHAINNGLWDAVYRSSLTENERRKKAVIATDIKTGEVLEFDSVSEAERTVGTRHVVDVIKGKRKQAKGYAFTYREGVMP